MHPRAREAVYRDSDWRIKFHWYEIDIPPGKAVRYQLENYRNSRSFIERQESCHTLHAGAAEIYTGYISLHHRKFVVCGYKKKRREMQNFVVV